MHTSANAISAARLFLIHECMTTHAHDTRHTHHGLRPLALNAISSAVDQARPAPAEAVGGPRQLQISSIRDLLVLRQFAYIL